MILEISMQTPAQTEKVRPPTHLLIMRLNRVVKVGVIMRNNPPLKNSADIEHSTFT